MSFRLHLEDGLSYSLTDRLKAIRRTKVYDLFTALPLIAWYVFALAQTIAATGQQIVLAKLFIQTDVSVLPISFVLSIVSKVCTLAFLAVLVVMFALRRVPQRRANGTYPRFTAVVGTFISVGIVLLPPQEISPTVYLASMLLVIGGTAVAVFAAVVLGRSISIMPEARQLVTWGPYALIRHPLYLGEMVATFGLAAQYLLPWALVLLTLHCIFQLERMKYEERVLVGAFPNYVTYMARTARLVPGVY